MQGIPEMMSCTAKMLNKEQVLSLQEFIQLDHFTGLLETIISMESRETC